MPDERIDLLNGMLDFIVCVSRFDTELQNQSVDFVHDEGYFDAFLDCVPNNKLSANHQLKRCELRFHTEMEGKKPYAFNNVNNQNDTVNLANCGRHFINKIDVPRGVDEMDKMRLSGCILQD
jgi:hypothetical protein